MKISELTESRRCEWNEFVGLNAFGDAMQSWEWGLVKATGGDWRPLRLIAENADGSIIGGIAILSRSFPLIGTLYYAPRGPILADWSDKSVLESLIDKVKDRAKQDNAMALKIDPALMSDRHDLLATLRTIGFSRPAGQDAQGFGGTQPKAVMILDIEGKSDDDLLMIFKAQCRRNVRIAEKKGVNVITNCSREHLIPFYDILTVTAKRDGFIVRPFSYYETLWDHLVENGLGKLFVTEFEGQYLSGALCFTIGDKAVYVYGASSSENRNVMPNYAMQWAMIRWARDIGCKTYDFRGVAPVKPGTEASPEAEHLQGLNRFKEGFGAEFVEYLGELDLVLDPIRYALWAKGKPALQHLRSGVKKVLKRIR